MSYLNLSLKDLRALCLEREVSSQGNKPDLILRLQKREKKEKKNVQRREGSRERKPSEVLKNADEENIIPNEPFGDSLNPKTSASKYRSIVNEVNVTAANNAVENTKEKEEEEKVKASPVSQSIVEPSDTIQEKLALELFKSQETVASQNNIIISQQKTITSLQAKMALMITSLTNFIGTLTDISSSEIKTEILSGISFKWERSNLLPPDPNNNTLSDFSATTTRKDFIRKIASQCNVLVGYQDLILRDAVVTSAKIKEMFDLASKVYKGASLEIFTSWWKDEDTFARSAAKRKLEPKIEPKK